MKTIKVINFDTTPREARKVEMFPNILRCGIFGPSGSGKSNALLTILVHVKPYTNLYLCSKTTYQDKYRLLDELIQNYNKKRRKGKIKFKPISNTTDLPQPEDIEEGSTVIFDDILTENQTNVANFFLRGRHRGISCFYLSQAYVKIPKKSGIRENFNYLILFRQDLVNLRQLYNEYITDFSFDKFRQLCNHCWRQPFGFLVIDVDGKCKYKNKFETCLKKV